ncbi:SapC family protein [Massilia sp. Dwa41.01b]|uniref:SapC family protein n=1 Tax=unclassified Massilia TaxID=2609279 RepID=UPI001602B11B|nr:MULTISPECIES: SapC family protein [unclassified Massilia]QNA88273.1 SapC family protein [Massilia sp. Dwa41.01b]QNA99175.1 SapC family protein [Massilia sp. Se16.2.3]
MSKPVLLNNIDHKDLRVILDRGAAYGDAVMSALTFPDEFRTLQAHYPVVFQKTQDGTSFQALALFGFQEGENLFLEGERWDAIDLPLTLERQPFLIGVDGEELMVHVDMASPRISAAAGEPEGEAKAEAVFMPHGGNSDYLERMNSTLLAIHLGLQRAKGFMAALLEHELLESFVFDIELDDGSQNRLWGFYTINEERLAALDGAALERLHRDGYLQPIYMAIASLSNLRNLVERKNRRNRESHQRNQTLAYAAAG